MRLRPVEISIYFWQLSNDSPDFAHSRSRAKLHRQIGFISASMPVGFDRICP
jgi:hypothetical protein